jgi:hypothetical protein
VSCSECGSTGFYRPGESKNGLVTECPQCLEPFCRACLETHKAKVVWRRSRRRWHVSCATCLGYLDGLFMTFRFKQRPVGPPYVNALYGEDAELEAGLEFVPQFRGSNDEHIRYRFGGTVVSRVYPEDVGGTGRGGEGGRLGPSRRRGRPRWNADGRRKPPCAKRFPRRC